MLGLFNHLGARYGMGVASNALLYVVPLLALALGLAGGGWAGWRLGRAPLHTELASAKTDMAQLRTTHAETARVAALAAAKGLQQAQQRGDALTTALAERQAQINQLSKDDGDALNRLTTGRACLGSAAVGVLNSAPKPAPAGHGPAVPQAPGSVAAADGAFATDADVGHWAIAARAQYGDCRARLAALIDWHTAGGARHED